MPAHRRRTTSEASSGGWKSGRIDPLAATRVGVGELACPTEDRYVDTAVGIVRDLSVPPDLRRKLWQRMAASPSATARASPVGLEAAYRAI